MFELCRSRIRRGLGGTEVAVQRGGSGIKNKAAIGARDKVALDLCLNGGREFSL